MFILSKNSSERVFSSIELRKKRNNHHHSNLFSWHKDTVVFDLEPFLGVFFAQSVWSTDSALAFSSSGNSLAWSFKDYEKVHTEDTDAWIVFDSEIDVFLDTESETAHAREVTFFELVFFDFQAGFKNFFGFWSSDNTKI